MCIHLKMHETYFDSNKWTILQLLQKILTPMLQQLTQLKIEISKNVYIISNTINYLDLIFVKHYTKQLHNTHSFKVHMVHSQR